MNEEESSDKSLRSSFGDKWNRTKSEDLTKSFKEQGEKYQVGTMAYWNPPWGIVNAHRMYTIYLPYSAYLR